VAFEDCVQAKVTQGLSILGMYPLTDEQSRIGFAAWRQANRR
jgi:hypothetical protein